MVEKKEEIGFTLKDIKDAYESKWFIFKEKQFLIIKGKGSIEIPTLKICEGLESSFVNKIEVGNLKGESYYSAEIIEEVKLPDTLEWTDLRDDRFIGNNDIYYAGIRAYQFLSWDKASKFCGKCGTRTHHKGDEIAKRCSNCGFVQYPRISPAIIVGIKKGNEILLAHNATFPKDLYSVIAGFAEQGETLEQTVIREIYEEVGIKVKNIKYFGSSPYSSEDSLMIAYVAEYESGEIKVDNKEIVSAGWYNKGNMPPKIPTKLTIARAIIDHLLDN
ncbi:MAG: NAD(+) diphosphatase [Clostridium sp.]